MADFSQFGDKLIIRISGLLFQLSWIVKDCGHSMFRRKAMPVLSEQGSKNSICCDENCDKARAQWCSWDIKIILTGFEKYGLIFGLFLFLVSSLHKMAGLYANRVKRQKKTVKVELSSQRGRIASSFCIFRECWYLHWSPTAMSHSPKYFCDKWPCKNIWKK